MLLAGCGNDPEPLKPVVVRGIVVSTAGLRSPPVCRALDANEAPISGTVTTNVSGAYELDGFAARNQSVLLRASASGFESFPAGIRRSLPIDISGAVDAGPVLVYSGTLTQITLEPLADPRPRQHCRSRRRHRGPDRALDPWSEAP
jgi:hypothetical protein